MRSTTIEMATPAHAETQGLIMIDHTAPTKPTACALSSEVNRAARGPACGHPFRSCHTRVSPTGDTNDVITELSGTWLTHNNNIQATPDQCHLSVQQGLAPPCCELS